MVAAAVAAVGVADVRRHMSEAPALSDRGLQSTTLANGIRVVTDRMPLARSVSSGIWVKIGGRDEDESLAGASHFLEHLLFKGTEARSARSIAEDVESVGGEMNAHTSREYTAFYTRLPDHAWRMGVEILGDILAAPAFRAHEVEAERQVILEEILMSLDTPDDVVHQQLAEAMFPGHPLGREVLGSADTVTDMSRDQIRSFFGAHYRPANLVVVAAGNLEHDEFVASVERTLGLAAGGVESTRTPPPIEVESLRVVDKPIEQVHLALGWRGVGFDHDDRYALGVANQILGGGMSSRLFQEIREERGLVYTVYSYAASYTDSGAMTVYAGTGAKRVGELLEVLDAELDRFVAGGVTERELEIAKGYLTGATVLGLEDSGGRMSRVGRTLMHRDDVLSIDEQLDTLRSVTAADVQRVAAKVLSHPRTTSAVGPVNESVFA